MAAPRLAQIGSKTVLQILIEQPCQACSWQCSHISYVLTPTFLFAVGLISVADFVVPFSQSKVCICLDSQVFCCCCVQTDSNIET